jgi:hypothetical protein
MPAGIVHKNNGMTGRQGLPASPKTGACRRSCKFLSENMGGHLPTSIAQSQSGATCQRPPCACPECPGRVTLRMNMNLTIELSDQKAAALKAQAEAQGITVERLVEQIAEQHAETQSASIAHLQKTDPQEWARRFHEWAESHNRTTPLLSDESISRESMYPDRS